MGDPWELFRDGVFPIPQRFRPGSFAPAQTEKAQTAAAKTVPARTSTIQWYRKTTVAPTANTPQGNMNRNVFLSWRQSMKSITNEKAVCSLGKRVGETPLDRVHGTEDVRREEKTFKGSR
jgi:hypothetical protein